MKKFALMVVMVLTLVGTTRTTVKAAELDNNYKAYVVASATQGGIDPYIVLALIEHESNNNPNAVNSDGSCVGLGQIHRCWQSKASSMGLNNLKDPYQNISWICYMLSGYNAQYHGDYNKVLVHYNAGHLYADSSSYSRSIVSRAGELRQRDTYQQMMDEVLDRYGASR